MKTETVYLLWWPQKLTQIKDIIDDEARSNRNTKVMKNNLFTSCFIVLIGGISPHLTWDRDQGKWHWLIRGEKESVYEAIFLVQDLHEEHFLVISLSRHRDSQLGWPLPLLIFLALSFLHRMENKVES